MIQYQWGQTGLSGQTGTAISPSAPSSNPTSPVVNGTGVSPNDGYSITGVDQSGAQTVRILLASAFDIHDLHIFSQVLTDAGQQIASDTPSQ